MCAHVRGFSMQIHGNLALAGEPVRLIPGWLRAMAPARKVKQPPGQIGNAVLRAGNGQGVWSPYYKGIVARAVAPQFYEVLRESIPILDGAIDRLTTIDGVPMIEGEDASIVAEASEWARQVQVNDTQHGLAAFAMALRGETHEQGFGVGEYVSSDAGDDIVRLNVADSKAIHFARDAETGLRWYYNPTTRRLGLSSAMTAAAEIFSGRAAANTVTSAMSGLGYVELNQANKVYMAYFTENADPYGVSRFRSLELVSKALLTIENGVLNSWERFGDPSFHVHHKATKRLKPGEAETRRAAIATDFQTALAAKREGMSMDFVTVADMDGDIAITIIGAGADVLEVEMPARHVLEQIVAKLGLAAWTLGLHFSTAERLAKYQSELMKQESDTRTDIEEQTLDTIVAAMLRARGRTWSDEMVRSEDGKKLVRKAWRVTYRKPNLADQESEARANFMNAQAEAVRDNAGGASAVSVSIEEGKTVIGFPQTMKAASCNHMHSVKALETRPIDNPALDRVENDAVAGTLGRWIQTGHRVLALLALPDEGKAATSEGFTFTEKDKLAIVAELTATVDDIMGADGGLAQAYDRSWSQGVIDAYMQSGLDGPIGSPNNASAVANLRGIGDRTFRTNLEQRFSPRIWTLLEQQASVGESPINVARRLNAEFEGYRWKFEQIARSEVAIAHDAAKRSEFGEEVADGAIEDTFDWIPAPDACPQCMGMKAGNPYTLAALPRPVIDTHPSDRCTTAPHIE